MTSDGGIVLLPHEFLGGQSFPLIRAPSAQVQGSHLRLGAFIEKSTKIALLVILTQVLSDNVLPMRFGQPFEQRTIDRLPQTAPLFDSEAVEFLV